MSQNSVSKPWSNWPLCNSIIHLHNTTPLCTLNVPLCISYVYLNCTHPMVTSNILNLCTSTVHLNANLHLTIPLCTSNMHINCTPPEKCFTMHWKGTLEVKNKIVQWRWKLEVQMGDAYIKRWKLKVHVRGAHLRCILEVHSCFTPCRCSVEVQSGGTQWRCTLERHNLRKKHCSEGWDFYNPS